MDKCKPVKCSEISDHLVGSSCSRREFSRLAMAGAASASALLQAAAGRAETPTPAIRIAFISPSVAPAPNQPSPFKTALQALGWTEGDKFIIESRFAAGQFQKIPDYVAELSRQDVKVFYVSGSQAAAIVKQTTTIPIVMIGDPAGANLVASFDRPGGNVTGFASVTQEICEKRLTLLKDIAPDITRAAFIANPENPATPNILHMTKPAAEGLGIELVAIDVRSEKDMEAAFETMAKADIRAFVFYPVAMSDDRFRLLAQIAIQRRLLWSDEQPRNATLGALLSYGPDYPELSRRAASYVDKILRGASPADLPIGVPNKFELVINLKTAQNLSITVPESVLSQASKVVR